MARQPIIRLDHDAVFSVANIGDKSLKLLQAAGWDSGKWHALFAVHVKGSGKPDPGRPAMLGSYRIEKGRIVFEPRFPLEPSICYRAVFDPSLLPGASKAKPVEAEFTLPRPASVPTVVMNVYPSTDQVPENLLKFYIHFSAPMSRGEAYQHLHLLNAQGKAVDMPFLELDQELWDPQGKRFTLFFDPGRIKRGLKPREDVGPVLEEGKTFTLVIDKGWPDAKGQPLRQEMRKAIQAGPPIEKVLEPGKWKVEPPAAGKRQPLKLTFPAPLDHALLERVLWVKSPAGDKLAGTISITSKETCWQFTPAKPWQAGGYSLVIDKNLEDLAGNNLARPFEVDVFHPVQMVKEETIELPFQAK